jgi:hypothetical protein
MKASLFGFALVLAFLCSGSVALAQYKAPSQYFRKDSPRNPGSPGAPSAPSAPGKPAPAAPAVPKFKDLPVNSQFYFLSDTNRAYSWTKISTGSAKNTKNGVTQAINGETPVRR